MKRQPHCKSDKKPDHTARARIIEKRAVQRDRQTEMKEKEIMLPATARLCTHHAAMPPSQRSDLNINFD